MPIRIWEIPRERVAETEKFLKEEEKQDAQGKFIINEFARNGYIFREGKIMGMQKDVAYLYIEALDEFFKKNEKNLPKGLKELKGTEYNDVKKKIEKEQENSALGVGFIFGE